MAEPLSSARRWLVRAGIAAAIGLAAPPAGAQTSEQTAERLFNEATALVSAKRYSEACPKLEASQKLDPALGTQFNLADCYENTGRPASAWSLFLEVVRLAKIAGKSERERLARDRATELESRLARVHLNIADPAPGLTIKRDGVPLAQEDWSKATPIDPGEHVFEASAPNAEGWKTTITIPTTAMTHEIEVPKLRSTGVNETRPAAVSSGLGTQRVIALGLAGAGVVGLGIGTVFGVMAISRHGDAADSACPDGGACTDRNAVEAWDSARAAGNVSTLALAAGGVLLVGGAVLWLTGGRSSSTAPSARGSVLRLGVVSSGTSLGLRGTF